MNTFYLVDAFVSVTSQLQACQFVSSSEETPNAASTAVSTSNLGWKPSIRGSPFCGQEYLQVRINNKNSFDIEQFLSQLLYYLIDDGQRGKFTNTSFRPTILPKFHLTI